MTWYLPNSKVRPVGMEVAEFIDAPDVQLPRRPRGKEVVADGPAVAETTVSRDTEPSTSGGGS